MALGTEIDFGETAGSIEQADRAGASSPRRLRVVFFGMCLAGVTTNGGSLCSRTHLQALSEDPGVDLTAVITSRPEHTAGNREYLASLGITPHLIDATFASPRKSGAFEAIRERWPIPLEPTAQRNQHINGELERICDAVEPDFLIIEYLPSVQLCQGVFRSKRFRTCVITVNREAEMLRDLTRLGIPIDDGRVAGRVSHLRLSNFERWVHRNATIVATIGRHDLPKQGRAAKRAVWMAPAMKRNAARWSGKAIDTALFVGNIAHYPNRLAIEWLAVELAPRLALHAPTARIVVLGAAADAVPSEWRVPNISYLGAGDEALKETLFLESALFLAPIHNTYGAKFKVAEVFSFGMPVFGSEGALSGVPFLTELPILDLRDPEAAANFISTALADRAFLERLSGIIEVNWDRHLAQYRSAWGHMLTRHIAEHG